MSLPSSGDEGGLAGPGAVEGFWGRAVPTRRIKIPIAVATVGCAPLCRIAMSSLALPEENRAEVRSVDLRVAHCARLVLGGLIVSRSNRLTCRPIRVRRMAAQT